MSQHPSEQEFNTMHGQPKKSWFARHWFWVVPTIILLPVLCCCGGGGALVWFGIKTITELPPYQDSIAEVQQHPDIIAELGSPIPDPGVFEMMKNGGDMNASNTGATMYFDASVPIDGPNGSGTLYVVGESNDGGVTWVYTTREFSIDSTGETIYLPGSPEVEEQVDAPTPDVSGSGGEIPDQE